MKKNILIIFLLIPTALTAQWNWQYPKPQGNTLNDIFIFDSTTAVAVGELGTIIKTYDGGLNWSVEHHAGGTDIDLYSVHFTDTLNGWAAGGIPYSNKSVLLNTTDGGKNWTEVETGMKTKIDTTLPLSAVYFVDADTGFAVGEDGIVLRTTDGGESWDVRKIDDYVGYGWLDVFRLTEITFTDKQTGWIVGLGYYGNQIYKTTDCGRTWQWNEQIISPKFYGSINDICFIDKDNGYIIGDMGCFAKTTDGGVTWEYQNLFEKYQNELYEYFYSVYFVNTLRGWIVGSGFILTTTDGGENWTEVWTEKQIGTVFYKVRFASNDQGSEQIGWSVGGDGMIYKTTDTGESWTAQRDDKYGFSSIYFIDENTGWAVGDSGIVMHTENGGTNWYKQNQNDSLILYSLFAIDNKNVISVGGLLNEQGLIKSAMLLSTDDGGETWVREAFEDILLFTSTFFNDDSTGWIAGAKGTLLKTTNKGNNWYKVTFDSSYLNITLNNIHFINKDVGWLSLIGKNSLLKTTDNGENWNKQLVDENLSISSFHFINENIGWVVGGNYGERNIFKTTNGGINWTLNQGASISYHSSYSSVYFINENIGWIAGTYQYGSWYNSTIIKTTDAGNTWSAQNAPNTVGISNIFPINEDVCYAVGYDGIFKTTDGGGIVSIENEKGYKNTIPAQIELSQNYPNPFNPTTVIEYKLNKQQYVKLQVFNILGQEIKTLVNEEQNKGNYKVTWNPKGIASGIYFYQLSTASQVITKKMLLIK